MRIHRASRDSNYLLRLLRAQKMNLRNATTDEDRKAAIKGLITRSLEKRGYSNNAINCAINLAAFNLKTGDTAYRAIYYAIKFIAEHMGHPTTEGA